MLNTTPQGAVVDYAAELMFLATSDLVARVKGRAVPRQSFTKDTTVGWVPANLGIDALGHIAEGIPFGSTGDLRLKPDLESQIHIESLPGKPPLNLVFADIVETDGKPWMCCARTLLKTAIADLREVGITVNAAFEHEFTELNGTEVPHPFSLRDFRELEPVGGVLVNALQEAGIHPENWLAEYAQNQFEITVRPADALRAADHATALREIVYEVFSVFGRRASFAPVVQPDSGANGVHVHFSLNDLQGNTLMWDGNRPARISTFAAMFAAGITKYAPALAALFAPLVTSYHRLAPHNWSTARAFLGLQNREALVRICPTNEINGRDPRPQLHFEFRGGDAGANPWILLASILRAGLAGVRENLHPADVVIGELDLDGKHANLTRLPGSLEEALTRFEEDAVVRSWFEDDWVATYLAVKRAELEKLANMTLREQCAVYAKIY